MPLSTSDVHASTLWLTSVVEINRRIRETLETRAGLSVTQYRILLELNVNEGHLMCGALATLLFLSPAAVTHAVDYLLELGFVTRTTMESNRRVTLVDVTPAGVAKVREADALLGAMLRRDVWSELDPNDLDTLLYGCSTAVAPFVGHTLLHGDVPVEPCYMTCAIIQQQCYESLLAELGMSLNEFRVALFALGAPRAARSSDFADALLLNRSSTSRAVGALKRAGVIEATVCADDSRASTLALTKAGRARTREAFERMTALDNSITVTPSAPAPAELNRINEGINAGLRKAAERDRARVGADANA